MRSRHALLLVALLAALSAQGCGSGYTDGEHADECSALLRYSNTTFRPDAGWQMPVRGKPLGRAGFLGCGGVPAPGLGKNAIFAVPGAGHTQAVIAAGRGGDTFYVAKDLPRRVWPAVMRTATRIMPCTAPMTFTGSWDLIETHSPGAGLYSDTVPYLAVFTAHSGGGIDPHVWAGVWIRAAVTKHTDPAPSVETATAAIRDHEPVTVSTTCTDDGHFEVAHLELSH